MFIGSENKRIKVYHIKGIGCPLLILIIFDQGTEKNDQTGTQASVDVWNETSSVGNNCRYL